MSTELMIYSFGISFMAEKWSESKIIGWAYAYEQITNVRSQIKPFITPTVDLAQMIQVYDANQ